VDNISAIVTTAIAKGELDQLLLGTAEYRYRSRWSPAPVTDLTELLGVVYERWSAEERDHARDQLAKALDSIVGTYDGLRPVASCILLETMYRVENKSLGLPLEDIAAKLRRSIDQFRSRLANDNTGEGAEWPDGRIGEFRRLSRNTAKRGGPSFCD
jgi:hypothetical protein